MGYLAERQRGFLKAPFTILMTASLLGGGIAASALDAPPAGLNEPVVIQGVDDDPLHAAIRQAAGRLTPGAMPISQGVPNQPVSWIVRHPVVTGTLVGTGVGFGLSRVDSVGSVNHDPRVTLIGTGAGAWGGLIASAVHNAHSGEKVGVGTKIGIAAGAVALIVLPALALIGAGG